MDPMGYIYICEYDWLVVRNMNFMTFHIFGNVIVPTDYFFRWVQTTNQMNICI